MAQALIGHTGFVGSNLLRSEIFSSTFNSKNVEDIRGRHFRRIVCAGIPAVKWLANQRPEADRDNIARLMDALRHVTADAFVLISTIDVYPSPIGVDEADTPTAADAMEPYGRHRLEFENFVGTHFSGSHIVRLPALFGPGLKKNAIYDLLHDNRLEWVHPESLFQWYPIMRLAADVALIERSGPKIVNIATEPVTIGEIQRRYFPGMKLGGRTDAVAHYDFRTRYDSLWGRQDGYCMSRSSVLASIADYLRDCRAR
jgi:nucleoside-diphosphate-sugar epimerase